MITNIHKRKTFTRKKTTPTTNIDRHDFMLFTNETSSSGNDEPFILTMDSKKEINPSRHSTPSQDDISNINTNRDNYTPNIFKVKLTKKKKNTRPKKSLDKRKSVSRTSRSSELSEKESTPEPVVTFNLCCLKRSDRPSDEKPSYHFHECIDA